MRQTTTSASNPAPFSPAALRPQDRLEWAGVYAAALTFPAMTLSISGTQILIAFCFVFFFAAWLVDRLLNNDSDQSDQKFDPRPAGPRISEFLRRLPLVWLAGGALFAWLVFSGFTHIFLEGIAAAGPESEATFSIWDSLHVCLAAIRRAVANEWSDLPLFLFGLLVYRAARNENHRRLLFGGLTAAMVLLIVTGLAAVFSEFRLARLIPYLIRQLFSPEELLATAANRPQHPFARLGELVLYRPIGFMNTRLTFAGLLMLTLPWAAGRAFLPDPQFRSEHKSENKSQSNQPVITQSNPRRQLLRRFFWAALVLAGGLLLILNGTRSILLGAGFTAAIGGWMLLRAYAWPRRWLILATLVTVGIAIGLYTVSSTVQIQTDRRLASVQRHTDFARPILWTVAGELVVENPILGVGPGNFEPAGITWREQYVREHPATWYFFQNTPRGHAHNDLLHLAAIGGVPAALFFLALIFLTVRMQFGAIATGSERPRDRFLVLGALGFFVAGIAQCYFQDDEVTTLFWALLGLATGVAISDPKTGTPDTPRPD